MVRTRKRGKTFSYIFEAGKKADGKRKVVEKGGFATKKAAYDAGVAAYNDWKHGNIGITSENISLKDFMQNWLENSVALNVKANSLQRYFFSFRKHILPKLGEIPVQELTPAKLDAWIRDLQKSGYAKNTISSVHAVLHHALDYAVYPAELISSNPANYIKVPKNAPTNVVQRHIITQEKLNDLLAKYPFGTPYYIPILILFHTGMRISEVCGLTWNDIDFDKKIITVDKQVVYLSRRGYFFSSPKTKSSHRQIVIDDFFAGELKRWQNQQADSEKSVGDSYVYIYKDTDNKIFQQSKCLSAEGEKIELVCTRPNGQFVSRQMLIKMFTREGINAHSFRHTHATTLIENGATPKGVAGRLGHTNATITQNLYTHNTEKLQTDTADIFSKILQTKT